MELYNKLTEAMKKAGFYINDSFSRYGNNEDYEIDSFAENFLLKNGAIAVRTNIIDAFESPGYDSSVLSVAWVDDKGLQLKTWLLEMY